VLNKRVRPGVKIRWSGRHAAIAGVWLAVAMAASVCLWRAGAPGTQVAVYLSAWVIGSTFPGVMIWRALAGHSTLVKELGFGSALGIVLQLLAWAIGTGVGHPRLMIVLPFGVLLAFLLVPRLRQHWWPHRSAALQTPVRWHIAMGVVIALAIYRFYRLQMIQRALPPEPSIVGRDSWYNSAISYELTRTLRPQDPFAAGEQLRYHWFADAHVTATAELSGVPVVNAIITLWFVPILIVLLLAVAAAAAHFMDGPAPTPESGGPQGYHRRWWVGPVAAFFTMVAPALWRFGSPPLQRVGDGFGAINPSGILALVMVLGIAGPMLDILRNRARTGTWVVLALLLATSVGTKPSILPVVAFGAGVVLAVDLLRARRLNRAMLYILGFCAALAIGAAPILTGSTGGSHIQLLALVTIDPSYAELLDGRPVVPAAGGYLVPALAERLPDAAWVIAMLLIVWILTETPRLLSLLGLFARPLRNDPGVVWGSGVVGGGYAAMWLLAHPGYSQHWFWTVTTPLATVLTVTNATRLLPTTRRARTLLVAVILLSVPTAIAAYGTTLFDPVRLDAPTLSVIAGRIRPYALLLGALAISMAVALLLRSRARSWSLPILTAAAVASLAACIPVPYLRVQGARPPRMEPPPQVGVTYEYISPEQQQAAMWLQRNTSRTAVVATNIFCWPMGRDQPDCVKSSMWLSGISGRRMVLSDWTYTSANERSYDGTTPLAQMPAPWPERQRLSLQAIENPTKDVLRRLNQDYGAQWIFADTRASEISPRLKNLASLRYESKHIKIYRLSRD
jgi:hypothetical protein